MVWVEERGTGVGAGGAEGVWGGRGGRRGRLGGSPWQEIRKSMIVRGLQISNAKYFLLETTRVI